MVDVETEPFEGLVAVVLGSSHSLVYGRQLGHVLFEGSVALAPFLG
jgi:hypothetical protein